MKLKVYFSDETNEIREFDTIAERNEFIEIAPFCTAIIDGDVIDVIKIEDMKGVVLYENNL